jgi:hypothetical protein
MTFFRQFIAPVLIVLVFLVSLLAVSARIFLPTDMAAPAPTEEIGFSTIAPTGTELPPALSMLINGLPDDPALLPQ